MAKVEIKERSGCTKKLHVEVERERFDSEFSQTLKKLKKDIQIPGFRKGKAPESLITQRFGPVVREETVKDLIPKVLQEVWESEGINPVGEPMITDLHFDQDGPISFNVAVEEIPGIDISGLKDVRATKEIAEIFEEDVDNALESYRNMRTEQKEVDRAAKEGDLLVVNLQQMDSSGVPIIGEKREHEVVSLEPGNPLPKEITGQMDGMKIGERRTIKFDIDTADQNIESQRLPEAYEIEVEKVIENIVPELNDEFASSTGIYSDLADLREKTREHLEKQMESQAERKLQFDIIDEFIKQAPFEVPDSMVKSIMFSELENRRKSWPDQPIEEESFFREIRPDAVRAVQTFIIIDAVKDQNNLEVTKEEISGRIEEIAGENGMEPRELRRQLIKNGRYEDIRNSLLQQKAYDWIVEKADVRVEKVKREKDKSNIIVPNRSIS